MFFTNAAFIPHIDVGLEQDISMPEDSYVLKYFDVIWNIMWNAESYFEMLYFEHKSSPLLGKPVDLHGCEVFGTKHFEISAYGDFHTIFTDLQFNEYPSSSMEGDIPISD